MRDEKNSSSGWPLGDSPEEFAELWKLTGAWQGGPEPAVESALDRLHQRLDREPTYSRPNLFRRWSRVAAAALLLLVAGGVFYLALGDRLGQRTLRTGAEIATVALPDGSQVLLNKNSELRWNPNAFDAAERAVSLTGEAFFEVTPDAARPFRVRTASTEVQVLGTSFNLRAYPGEDDTEVAVLTGRVLFRSGTDSLQLEAAQCARAAADSRPVLEPMNASNAIAWQTGQLVFRDAPLPLVVRQLEHFFAVRIEWQDAPHTSEVPCTVSAKWTDPELEQVLTALERLTGLHPQRLAADRYRLMGHCQG
jgi:ferric-dicitrate binding protein FerR (iron transport regulator)